MKVVLRRFVNMPILLESDSLRVNEIEANVKNKWNWRWLGVTDDEGTPYSVWCRKLDTPGECFCIICSEKMKYGSSGKKILARHAGYPGHKKNMKVNTCINY